jgi:hypothetical protein
MRTTFTGLRIVGTPTGSSHTMADSHDAHGHADPNAAPTHGDVRASFSPGAVFFCYALAAIALIAGVITGLTVVNN